MTTFKAIGNLFRDSGSNALTEVGVTSSGTAGSFLTAFDAARTMSAHQTTACTLSREQQTHFLLLLVLQEQCLHTRQLLARYLGNSRLISNCFWCCENKVCIPDNCLHVISGTADSFLTAFGVARTRSAYQTTACTLSREQQTHF